MTLSRITIVMVLCFAILIAPVYADWGICKPDPTAPGGTSNTIECISSTCVGTYQVDYALNYCDDHSESFCTETPAYIFSTIQGKLKEGSWGSFIACIGGDVACAACVAGAAAICLSPPWLACALGAGGCALVCAGISSGLDACCWSTCVLDMSTLHKTGGGRTC